MNVLTVIGKFGITGAYAIIIFYVAELFPTMIRLQFFFEKLLLFSTKSFKIDRYHIDNVFKIGKNIDSSEKPLTMKLKNKKLLNIYTKITCF